VTAPSLPGQGNKEGVVKPDTGMPTDSEGYAVTKRYEPGAAPANATPLGGAKGSGAAAGAGASAGPASSKAPIGPAPTGKAVVTGTNTITLRGSVVALEAGKSVTIRDPKTGIENTYSLAPGAAVDKDVAPGSVVRVRVLAAQKGKVADRVTVVQATPPPPVK
jgi:hypothetical protein